MNVRGGESLPVNLSPAGRLAPRPSLEPLAPRPYHHRPFEAYIVDFRKLKGLTPGGTRGSGRRPQSPRPPIDCLQTRWLYRSDIQPRFASWRGVPISLDFLRNTSLAIY